LVYSTKPTPSLDDVVVKSRGAWCGGYTESVGFAVVHYKTIVFLGSSIKPIPKAQWAETGCGFVEKLRSERHAVGSWGLHQEDADYIKGVAAQ
jgi:hypothetical protein